MEHRIGCILWDFGDTLADEKWMWANPQGISEWRNVYERLDELALADPWNKGEITSADVAENLATQLPMDSTAVLDHMKACCANVRVFKSAMEFATKSDLRQAIVTVNPDLFSREVVPALGLDATFDQIITSWQEHTVDKAALCHVALKHMRFGDPIASALLIDNKEENARSWRQNGGSAYVFQSDESFKQDLESGLESLAFST